MFRISPNRIAGCKAIRDKYGVPANQMRVFFHYVPTYYHLHVYVFGLRTGGIQTRALGLFASFGRPMWHFLYIRKPAKVALSG
jgi:hypothetical protein